MYCTAFEVEQQPAHNLGLGEGLRRELSISMEGLTVASGWLKKVCPQP